MARLAQDNLIVKSAGKKALSQLPEKSKTKLEVIMNWYDLGAQAITYLNKLKKELCNI